MRGVNDKLLGGLEALLIPVAALLVTLGVFGLFVACSGVNPLDMYALMYKGGFGTWFSWQNTLQRAAPLILTALCTAIPAQLGLIIIGGEGAMILGGVGAAMVALSIPHAAPVATQIAMGLAGLGAGGCFILLVGTLRHYRGINETISSLLLTYVAIAVLNHMVEGPLRDPGSLNKPSTGHIGEANMVGLIPGMDVHARGQRPRLRMSAPRGLLWGHRS
jgi:simple sugar transport system permease protein